MHYNTLRGLGSADVFFCVGWFVGLRVGKRLKGQKETKRDRREDAVCHSERSEESPQSRQATDRDGSESYNPINLRHGEELQAQVLLIPGTVHVILWPSTIVQHHR